MAYASVSDLIQRWKTLSAEEQTRAAVMLDDAATLLESLVTVDGENEKQLALLKTISCSMVKRALSSIATGAGVSQSSISADIYTQSWTYSNPSGDLYLTALEKKLLGISNSYIGSIPAACGSDAS